MRKVNYQISVKKAFTGFTFGLFLCSNLALAQKKDSVEKVLKPSITLTQGATLFSTDSAFNNQISSKKVVRNNAEVIARKDKDSKVLQMKTPHPGAESISEKDKVRDDKRKKNDSISNVKEKASS